MKIVTTTKKFTPITVTIETAGEAAILAALIGRAAPINQWELAAPRADAGRADSEGIYALYEALDNAVPVL